MSKNTPKSKSAQSRSAQSSEPAQQSSALSTEPALNKKAPPVFVSMDNSLNYIEAMLVDEPNFAFVNFKEVMIDLYKRVRRTIVKQQLAIDSDSLESIQTILQNASFRFEIDQHSQVQPQGQFQGQPQSVTENCCFFIDSPMLMTQVPILQRFGIFIWQDGQIKLKDLFRLMLTMHESEGTDTYRYLFYLSRLAFLIIESDSFVPAVVEEGKRALSILYKPLENLPEVRHNMNSIASITPDSIYRQQSLQPLSSYAADFDTFDIASHCRLRNYE